MAGHAREITIVSEFRRLALQCRTDFGLKALLGDAATDLGFDYFALIAAMGRRHSVPFISGTATYPEAWTARQLEQLLYIDDPILLACRYCGWGFSWDEIGAFMPLRTRHRSILVAAASCGLRQGFTVPVNIPFEPPGSCSFASRRAGVIPQWRRRAAELIGITAIRTARRILGLSSRPLPIHLSPRELQVLEWIAEGKSNTDIATILGIGLETVKSYVRHIIAKFGAADRTQAAILAARSGLVLTGPICDLNRRW